MANEVIRKRELRMWKQIEKSAFEPLNLAEDFENALRDAYQAGRECTDAQLLTAYESGRSTGRREGLLRAREINDQVTKEALEVVGQIYGNVLLEKRLRAEAGEGKP